MKPRSRIARWLLAAVALLAAGCGENSITAGYGRRSGFLYGDSVNGTAVLADMFQSAGDEVISWSVLSPAIERADVIVWFPDDFEGPALAVRRRLNEWLMAEPGRTLVYVGRDFDAAPLYWSKVLPGAPAGQVAPLQSRKASADQVYAAHRAALPTMKDYDWFKLNGGAAPRNVYTLDGPWSDDVAAGKVEIELGGRLVPDPLDTPLLTSGSDTLASRRMFGARRVPASPPRDEASSGSASQLIVVANGSFLLNLPLVNHEHRKLAARLIDEVQLVSGSPSQVLFLESDAGGPEILENDPRIQPPTGLEDAAPLCYVAYHLIALGVIVVTVYWPIFGRPRRLTPAGGADFGRHVDSLGELLEKSRDTKFCMSRIVHYQQTVRGRGEA
jgi:hypothetical protein